MRPLRLAYFLQPLDLDDVAHLHVDCAIDLSLLELEILSVESVGSGTALSPSVHFKTSLSSLYDGAWLPAQLHALRGRSPQPTDASSAYISFARIGLEYGAGHRTLVSVWSSSSFEHAVGRLRDRAESQGTMVHPADLDGALQLPMVLTPSTQTRLPFAVGEAILSAGHEKMWPVSLQPCIVLACLCSCIECVLSSLGCFVVFAACRCERHRVCEPLAAAG